MDGKLVSRIGPGVVALIGISTEDTMEEIGPLANKIVSLKVSLRVAAGRRKRRDQAPADCAYTRSRPSPDVE